MRLKSIFYFGLFISIVISSFSQDVRKIKITELETMIKESKTPMIINFWATYCKPCIEEMPDFIRLTEKYKQEGISLLLVSLDMEDDYPAKVNEFVSKRKIKNIVLWLDETNADYFCPKVDPQWSGAIPSTLFINNQNGYRRFFEKKLSVVEIEKEIGEMKKR